MTTLARRVLARYLIAASKKTQAELDAEAEERLQERMGEVSDAIREAEELHESLKGDPNDELDNEADKAEKILDALRNCETVETEEDFDLSFKEALKDTESLVEDLKKAKAKLKKEPELKESYDLADDCLVAAKGLLKELHSLEPES